MMRALTFNAMGSLLEVPLGNTLSPCVATLPQSEGRGLVWKTSTDSLDLLLLYVNRERSY